MNSIEEYAINFLADFLGEELRSPIKLPTSVGAVMWGEPERFNATWERLKAARIHEIADILDTEFCRIGYKCNFADIYHFVEDNICVSIHWVKSRRAA